METKVGELARADAFLGLTPRHVALIMDGTGAWATARGLPRIEGYLRGLEALRDAMRTAIDFGLSFLTVDFFSAEKAFQSHEDAQDLLALLIRFIHDDVLAQPMANVRLRFVGARAHLALDVIERLQEAERLTQANSGLTLVIAFNYDARQEIAGAVRALAEQVAQGHLSPEDISTGLIAAHLGAADIPDPDLIIRTSGEQRLSNFFLWQAAYAEFMFLPIYWPEFDKAAFVAAIAEYAGRDRRFGGVSACRSRNKKIPLRG
jgi:undecaprenyl diphosphate synthase